MAKLEILTPAEHTIFNAPPNFSQDEQNRYFCLPAEVAVWLKSVDSITNKAGFILLFAYCLAGIREFRATCKIIIFKNFITIFLDIIYVLIYF
ncbi:MAG: hypothetical protein HYX60_09245 [Legionella longbeachae]|nr:hypothetical protein [Legionella longbeachae]